MTETLLELLPRYGLWMMFAITLLSALALPLPASIIMLTAGGFAASGDLDFWRVSAACLAGVLIGDQIGFQLGRRGGGPLMARLRDNPKRAVLIDKATGLIERRGVMGVFLSRWLFSPLGPWLNYVGGAALMPWMLFTLAVIAGDMIWVAIYVGLGYNFSDNVAKLGETLGVVAGFLVAALVTAALGYALLQGRKARQSAPAETDDTPTTV